VNSFKFTVVFYLPISFCKRFYQFAFHEALAYCHPYLPVGIWRLLIYSQRPFCASVGSRCVAGVGVITGGGVFGTTGVWGVYLVAKRTYFVRLVSVFLGRSGRRSVGLGFVIASPFYIPFALAYVMAMYLSNMSSSSSITSGSSSNCMSSGTVLSGTGGAMTPDDVAYPITALPFSIRVGVFVGGLF
jgi:hypothetical protein